MWKLPVRFSLRTLLIVFTLIAAYLGAWDATKRFGVSSDNTDTTITFDDDSTTSFFVWDEWSPVPLIVIGNEEWVSGNFATVPTRQVAFIWLFGPKLRVFPRLPSPQDSPTNQALRNYDEAIRLDPNDFAAYNDRGLIWLKKDEKDKALADFEEAIKVNPKYAPAFASRAKIWIVREVFDRAIDDLSESIRLNPNEPQTYVERANTWISKGKMGKAYWDVKEALELDPNNLSAQHAAGKLRAIAAFDE